jgi:hypothetical protein
MRSAALPSLPPQVHHYLGAAYLPLRQVYIPPLEPDSEDGSPQEGGIGSPCAAVPEATWRRCPGGAAGVEHNWELLGAAVARLGDVPPLLHGETTQHTHTPPRNFWRRLFWRGAPRLPH